ncbi:uncharacterized protein LOC123563982 [Mercenaria mercenaria]|uniref:uncharacterized protein LOC123563982 n=1 Tax=Mercenaria mercenaria TaxID=6596 RepID=UPI001E1D7FF3|nr:uncharacterized protein LOC123563982 [Mercenaria mercenaria]
MKTPEKKKKNYSSKYNAWEQEFPWISKADNGLGFAFCKLCRRTFSVSHAGKNDVRKHGQTLVHSKTEKSELHTSNVRSYFVSADEKPDVINAEIIWAQFVAETNLPFSVSDTFNKAVKVMFPDSDIAKKFQ